MSEKSPEEREFFVHLVSDATGSTLQGLARACLAQFDGIHPIERFWPLIRTERQLQRVIDDIKVHPGPVLFTLIDQKLRQKLRDECEALGLPCMPVLEPLIRGMSAYLGKQAMGIPGRQHELNEAYFERIEAVDFALHYDDGQSTEGIGEADIILVGVSRTSKTPTCIFLARRGIKAANIPLVPGVDFPEHITQHKRPLFVGLTESPQRLVKVRENRLKSDTGEVAEAMMRGNTYLELEQIEEEIRKARKLFSKHGWPVIDVTKRSIEETAAEILILLQRHKEKRGEFE